LTVATDIPREARAFLDAVAVGEDNDPRDYDELVGSTKARPRKFDASTPSLPNCFNFPNCPGWGNSHAAGRYQFEPDTVRWVGKTFSPAIPDFRDPAWQDRMGWFLAQHDYRAHTGYQLLPMLRANRISGIAAVLKPSWASLDESTFRPRYVAALAPIPDGGVTAPVATIPEARDMQAALTAAGLYSGQLDGLWGPVSQRALAAYYARRGGGT